MIGRAALVAALWKRAGARGGCEAASDPWYSGIFSGQRHVLVLTFEGDGAIACVARLVEGLEDHEFTLPDRLVADIAATAAFAWDSRASVTIEALVLDGC